MDDTATLDPPARSDLSEVEAAILDFEARWWTFAGSKDAMIRERFAITSVRYYQVLNALVDTPAAMDRDPLLVRRLRRLRRLRTAERSAARAGLRASARPARD